MRNLAQVFFMDIFFLILAIILILIGFVGCLMPVLPGPPLSYVGLLLLEFTKFADFKTSTLIWLGVFAAIIQVLDYIMPTWGTKKFGGSKAGTWGSIVGLIAGMFFLPAIGPFGIITIIAGPFLGAYLGEKLAHQSNDAALKSAFGSFLGFIAGTFMKLVCSTIITIYFVIGILK